MMLTYCVLRHQVQLRHHKRKSSAIKELLSSSSAAAAAGSNDGSSSQGLAGTRAGTDGRRPQRANKQPSSSCASVLHDACHELWRAVGRLEDGDLQNSGRAENSDSERSSSSSSA